MIKATTVLLICFSAAFHSYAVDLNAASLSVGERRANEKYRVKVIISEPRQECAAFQAELLKSMMADGVSRAEVEREVDKILAEPGEMMNWTRAKQDKSYAKQYRDYFKCVNTTDGLMKLEIGGVSRGRRTTAPGAPLSGLGDYIRVGPREFSFLLDENRNAWGDYMSKVDAENSSRAPSSLGASAPPARTPPASSPERNSVASCGDEIKRVQIESQSWKGSADDVAARLGRYQKDLFEGRCAGHPDAKAYIAGANKMLAYGGNPEGSSGDSTAPLSAIRRDTKSKEHNPAHNASTCIQVYGPADMKARGLKSIMRSMLLNACPYSVSVIWCVEPGNGRPGDCTRGYSNLADLSAAGQQGSSRGIDADGQQVQYAACRLGPGMGFQPVEKDPRYPYRFSCS